MSCVRVLRATILSIVLVAASVGFGSPTATLASTSFAPTAPSIGSPLPIPVPATPSGTASIVAAGDIACDPAYNVNQPIDCMQAATANLIGQLNPTAVLTLGDNQYQWGKPAAYQAVFDPTWGHYKSILFPTIGNHEYLTTGAAGYFGYFGFAPYYSYDLASWHIVSLDSSCHFVGGCQAGSAQESWLRADLAAHATQCTLVTYHEPSWSSGQHGDASQMTTIWSDLVAAHVDVVLTGHNHDYERFVPLDASGQPDPTGTTEFVVGTGGKNDYGFSNPALPGEVVRADTTFGVIDMSLMAGGYSWQFVPVPGGNFTDSGSASCHPGKSDSSGPAVPAVPGTFHPITPVRLLDTRAGNGHAGKVLANTPITFPIAGRAGIPANASAVTGNLTVTGATSSWAVYVGPNPLVSPPSSTINFRAGETAANGVTAALGAGGSLAATYMGPQGGATDLVFDVSGYFTPDTSGATFHPLSPVRLLDTRSGNGLANSLMANMPATFQVAGRGGVPVGATAVTGNVTVADQTAGWAVALGPVPDPAPSTSTLNFTAGEVKANNLTVALSPTGSLSATYLSSPGQTTDLVFDVTGYYTADLTGAEFVPLTPTRLLDTRVANGLIGKFLANTPRSFQVTGRGGVPANATAVTGIFTVVDRTAPWAVFVGPDPTPAPTTSSLNFTAGQVASNGLTVALGSASVLSPTYISTSGNTTDLVFDVTGYFLPVGG